MIGNGGGGKSTLSRVLAARLGVPHHEVDPVQFRPDWSRVPEEEVARTLDGWLAGDGWVIDGFGPFPCIERRLAAADTIVWVDFPLARHLWWVTKRQLAWRTTPDGRERPPTRLMWRTIVAVHRTYRPRFDEVLVTHRHKLVHVRSPRELRRWLRAV